MPSVHPSAVVEPSVRLAPDVIIGPGCVLTGDVELAAGVRLTGANYVSGDFGPVRIGPGTRLWPHACVGFEPQDYKFAGVTGGVTIGASCMLREGATVHGSTVAGRPTVLGAGVFMMVNTHIAHDCTVGDRVVMVNGSALAGHCVVGDDVTLGGNAVVHQGCRIGRMVMMSGDCAINKDVPPFFIVSERNRIGGLNLVGLRRKGLREHIDPLKRAFAAFLYRPMPRPIVIDGLRGLGRDCPAVAEVAEFLAGGNGRGFVTGFGKPERGEPRASRIGGGGAGVEARSGGFAEED